MEIVLGLLVLAILWYFGKAFAKAGAMAEKAVITGTDMAENRLAVLAAESRLAKAERFAGLNVDKKVVEKAKANAAALNELDF